VKHLNKAHTWVFSTQHYHMLNQTDPRSACQARKRTSSRSEGLGLRSLR
jgi:uncharacterized C2H2 Zn-finger protein